MPSCYQPTIRAQRYAAIRQTSGLSIVNPTAMLETNGPVNCLSVEIGTRSKRNFHRPESNCGVAINSGLRSFHLTNVPNACASSVAGINPGSAHQRGRRRERDYRANEGAERGKPRICLHANYLKQLKIDISQNVNFFPEVRNFSLVGADFSNQPLTRFRKLYCYDKADVFRRADD